MPELSKTDLSLLEGLGRRLSRAPSVEVIASEVHKTLQKIGRVSEVRLITEQQPVGWREYIAGTRVVGGGDLDDLPQPPSKGSVAHFDLDRPEAGFLWISSSDPKCNQALHLIAPQAETAILLSAALKRSRRSSLHERELLRESFRSRDEERRRIACELHDDLGQSIASLKLNLKWVEDLIRSHGSMEEAEKELGAARSALGTILSKVRDLSHTLYPSILDSLGLTAAIKELVYQATKRAGIDVICNTTGTEKPLPKDVAVALYRCCQEAVNNAVRHSGASRILVDIAYTPGEVRITVEDNGRGFDPGNIHESGGQLMSSGFWTIRQRVADLGGAFRVSTARGTGAAIEITIPTNLRIFDARSKNKAANR